MALGQAWPQWRCYYSRWQTRALAPRAAPGRCCAGSHDGLAGPLPWLAGHNGRPLPWRSPFTVATGLRLAPSPGAAAPRPPGPLLLPSSGIHLLPCCGGHLMVCCPRIPDAISSPTDSHCHPAVLRMLREPSRKQASSLPGTKVAWNASSFPGARHPRSWPLPLAASRWGLVSAQPSLGSTCSRASRCRDMAVAPLRMLVVRPQKPRT